VRVAHHEKQLFTLRKYLFQVEKIEGCRIFQKTHFYQNVPYISVHAFSEFLKIFFSENGFGSSKTDFSQQRKGKEKKECGVLQLMVCRVE
jgi:hypothetical protein